MKSLNGLGVVLLAAGSLWLSSCGGHSGHGETHDAPPEVAVTVAQVTTEPGADAVVPTHSGSTEEVTLVARTQGRLTRLPKDEGESFRYGEPLALFESETNRSALEAAREQLDAAKISLETAERQHDRMTRLRENRVASERELEVARTELEAARAAQAGATAAYQRLLDDVILKAPFDGVVVLHRIDPGTIVSPGQPILHIRSVSRSGGAARETEEPSLWVPADCLVRRGGLTGVFVLEDDRAALRWIRCGREAGNSKEVLSGLMEGERVITAPAQLVDGQPVRVEP